MQTIRRMFESYRETILLPLVICVVLPGAAGAWWRHVHEEPRSQTPPLSSLLEAGILKPEACTPVKPASPRKLERTTRSLAAVTVPLDDR